MQANNEQNNTSTDESNNSEHWQQQKQGLSVNEDFNQNHSQQQSQQGMNQPNSFEQQNQQNQPFQQPQNQQFPQQGMETDTFNSYSNPNLDPYQAPQSFNQNQMNTQFSEENTSTWYDTSGRIGRLRYLSYSIVTPLLLSLSLGIIAGILGATLAALLDETGAAIGVLIYFLAMIPGHVFQFFIIPRRRLHDLDKSGWYLLIMLIPLINIFFILYLSFAAGDEDENDYGLPNRENQWWHYVLGCVLPIIYTIAMIGIIAAIALPAYQDYIDRSQQKEQQTIESFEQMIEDAQ